MEMKKEEYYGDLSNVLPRNGISSKYLSGLSPTLIRRFIGTYAFTNKMNSSLATYAFDSEKFEAQDNRYNHATFEFYNSKSGFDNGIRLIDEKSYLMFGKRTVMQDTKYEIVNFIEGRIFTEFGLFQIYNGTICFYKIDDLMRYAEEKNESLTRIQNDGLPMQNNVPCIEVSGDFDWVFNTVCSIREGNLEILNKFNGLNNIEMLQQRGSSK